MRGRVQSQHVQRCARIPRSPLLVAQTTSGEELEAFLERHQPNFDQIIYVGDGKNDYCPVLRLRRHVRWIIIDLIYSRTFSSQDKVLCRRLKGLEGRIEKEGPKDELKCQVYKWTEAWEVEEHFNSLWS
jgi:pyridoxal phosphate phosphatase PHOSPHO2